MLLMFTLSSISSIAVANRRDKSIMYSRTTIAGLVVCLHIALNSSYLNFLDKGLGLFNGLFHGTATTHTFHVFILIISCILMQLNSFFPRKVWIKDFQSFFAQIVYKFVYYNSYILNKLGEQFRILEYPLIIIFIIAGGSFLISSCDLMSIFLSIELQSYGLYILCTIYRNSEKATSGGLTYFLLGGLSSCFILLASSLLYGNSGNTSFDSLFIINGLSDLNYSEKNQNSLFINLNESHYISFSLIILTVGFLFKISAAPFHFWSPDVYDAIPTIVTSFVAVFAKITIFVLLLELVHYTNNYFVWEEFSSESFSQPGNIVKNNFLGMRWTFTLLISSVLSLIIGSVLGLTQARIKRLFAYSTISHLGFILLALTINSIESIQSFIFYLMQYSLSNLNAFLLLISMGYCLYIYVKKDAKKIEQVSYINETKNSPIQYITEIKGFFYINPVLSISLALTLFSFVGIPPLIGFFAKQMVLSSALDNGYLFITLIAVLASVTSAYYYLAIVKQMFFYKSDFALNPQIKDFFIRGNAINRFTKNIKFLNVGVNNISLTSSLSFPIANLTLIILFFILIPQQWLSMANILALIMFNS